MSQEISRVQKVYEIFKDFYGEDKVDLQSADGNTIVVYFPYIVVTNENNQSTAIYDTYVKIVIDSQGKMCGKFTVARSTYPYAQYISGYCHSHVPSFIYNRSEITSFKNSCLGSGPIVDTIALLNREFDESRWMLFCLELQKYLETESLSGGPYIRLENISETLRGYNVSYTPGLQGNPGSVLNIIHKFIKYLIKNKLLYFIFNEDKYVIAGSTYSKVINLSNYFIDFYNNQNDCNYSLSVLIDIDMVYKGDIKNYKFVKHFSNSREDITYTSYNNLYLLTFKGRDIRMSIAPPSNNANSHEVILLHPNVFSYVVETIQDYVNYFYTKLNNCNNEYQTNKIVEFI